jgi:predicted amidohydrolase YtcJ
MAPDSINPGGPYRFAGLPPLFSAPVLDAMLRDSLQHQYQLQVHVFGTPAATAMLDAMDRSGGARIWSTRRPRFEHGDGLTPELAARAKSLGVVVSQQGSHLDILGIDPAHSRAAPRQEPLASRLV